MSNHYSAFQDLSNFPLHSPYMLSCREANGLEIIEEKKAVLKQLNIHCLAISYILL